ncbi:MAG: SOS response-associated peptidase family protein [Erythrobacter sp.]|nr:SOS response-associated peptidase family protein [Erythrobacter sp.]
MRSNVDELRRYFGPFEGDRSNLERREEIYPGQMAPVLRIVNDTLTLDEIVWGVPPPAAATRPVTNVRNLSSPFWRPMLSSPAQRCLVPWTQFCEWTGQKGSKSKVWFERADTPVSAFAGLWRETDQGPRFAFLTTEVNQTVGAIHPKAMPVLLDADGHETWLSGDNKAATALARPFDDARIITTSDKPKIDQASLL